MYHDEQWADYDLTEEEKQELYDWLDSIELDGIPDVDSREPSACPQSSTGKHEWKRIEPSKTSDGREDWSVIPGTYCLHCEKKQS